MALSVGVVLRICAVFWEKRMALDLLYGVVFSCSGTVEGNLEKFNGEDIRH
jgi:hypothetical protein